MKLENLREERILQGKTQTYMAKNLDISTRVAMQI